MPASTTSPWYLDASIVGGGNPSAGGLYNTGGQMVVPAYNRVTQAPSFLPKLPDITSELTTEYKNTGSDYDINPYDLASGQQQSRVLTTALNAGQNAATEYANKARQAGGSGMGAGLVKAEAQVGGRATAGDLKLKQMQFDADMRDKAATHAASIATTLGSLRDNYLKSLVDYSTSEDATSASYAGKMAQIAADLYTSRLNAAGKQGGGNGGMSYTIIPTGGGDFQNPQQAQQFIDQHKGQYTPYGMVPADQPPLPQMPIFQLPPGG